MCRLIEEIVRSGLVTAWRFASCPTSRSPVFVKATTDGVVRDPSELAMTVGLCPSITATTEFVVPRSMPTTLAIKVLCLAFRATWTIRREPLSRAVRALPLTVAQGMRADAALPRRAALSYDARAALFHSPGMTVFPAHRLHEKKGRPGGAPSVERPATR